MLHKFELGNDYWVFDYNQGTKEQAKCYLLNEKSIGFKNENNRYMFRTKSIQVMTNLLTKEKYEIVNQNGYAVGAKNIS